MWKSKHAIWALALVLFCGCSGTSCETQATAPPPPLAPQVEKQARLQKPADLLVFHEIYTKGAKSGDDVPLIIAVHGLGDTPTNFDALFEDLPFKARVVLPRAPEPWGSGWAWFPYRIGDNEPIEMAKGIRSAASRVAKLAEYLSQGSSSKPVICGFSQGGMISYAVALLHPQTIAGAVPISGAIPPTLLPQEQLNGKNYPPIRALHGNADNIVTFPPTSRAVQDLKDKGLDIELQVYEGVGHSVIAPMQSYLYGELERMSTH